MTNPAYPADAAIRMTTMFRAGWMEDLSMVTAAALLRLASERTRHQ